MKKVLIEVDIPAAEVNYNIEVPLYMTAEELTILICKFAKKSLSHAFVPSSDTVLYDAKNKKTLDNNSKLGQIGILNGSKLILI